MCNYTAIYAIMLLLLFLLSICAIIKFCTISYLCYYAITATMHASALSDTVNANYAINAIMLLLLLYNHACSIILLSE